MDIKKSEERKYICKEREHELCGPHLLKGDESKGLAIRDLQGSSLGTRNIGYSGTVEQFRSAAPKSLVGAGISNKF